jgi:2-hydroxychromene-2-carboxylate isomerase
MAPIRFLFDFISPYAYLAWTEIHGLAARHGRTVELVPVLFAALLDAHGQKGPAEIEAKRLYTQRDVVRKAAVRGVPIAPPASHPFNPLLALRVATASSALERDATVAALFRTTWAESEDVSDPAVVTRVLSAAGLAGAALVARAADPTIKDQLRAETAAAVAQGVFGVPTMLCDGELFWGTDSMPLLDHFLAGHGPRTAETLASWSSVRPTAIRPGSR